MPESSPNTEIVELDFVDLLVLVAEHVRLLVLGPVAVGAFALAATFLMSPTFTARTSFLPPQQQHNASAALMAQLGALASLATSATGLKSPSDQMVSLLKSRTIADKLINEFDLQKRYNEDLRQDVREKLAARTNVVAGKDGLIVVQVDDESPDVAARLANSYVSALQSLLTRLALTEAQQRRAFFEKQMEQTRENLAAAERALIATGITPAAMKANPQSAVEGVAALQARVTAQEIRLSVMRGHLTETAPEFVQAQSELRALRSQLHRAEASEPKAAEPGGYIDSFRNFKYHETLFELFARQFEIAKIDEAREGALIQIVDTAQPPERKSRPRRLLIAVMSAVAAGILLFVALLIRQSLSVAQTTQSGAKKVAAIRNGFARFFRFHARG